MTRVNIELPDELHKKIKIVCAVKETTLKEFIRDRLDKKVNNKGKNSE